MSYAMVPEALENNASLQELYLHNNKIGDAGANALAKAHDRRHPNHGGRHHGVADEQQLLKSNRVQSRVSVVCIITLLELECIFVCLNGALDFKIKDVFFHCAFCVGL